MTDVSPINEAKEPTLEEVIQEIKMVETPDSLTSEPATPSPEETKAEGKQPVIEPKPANKSYEDYHRENYLRLQKKLLEEQRRAKQLAAERERAAEAAKRYDDLIQLKEKDPAKFLEEVQLNPELAVQKMLEDARKEEELTPAEREARLMKKAQELVDKRLEEEKEAARKEAEARHKKLYIEQTINSFQTSLREFVEQNQDQFELIHRLGQHGLVFNQMETFFNRYGYLPDLKAACEAVEEQVQKELEQALDVLTQSKKFSARLAGSNRANNSNGTRDNTKPITLTNDTARSSAAIKAEPDLDDKDAAFQAALDLIRYQNEE